MCTIDQFTHGAAFRSGIEPCRTLKVKITKQMHVKTQNLNLTPSCSRGVQPLTYIVIVSRFG